MKKTLAAAVVGGAGILALAGCGAAVSHPAPAVTKTVVKTIIVTRTAKPTAPHTAAPATAAPTTAAPTTAAPAATPPVPDINGATWSVTVNCAASQCTSFPDAGPGLSTCGAVVNNEQVCVGSGTANQQQAEQELGQS